MPVRRGARGAEGSGSSKATLEPKSKLLGDQRQNELKMNVQNKNSVVVLGGGQGGPPPTSTDLESMDGFEPRAACSERQGLARMGKEIRNPFSAVPPSCFWAAFAQGSGFNYIPLARARFHRCRAGHDRLERQQQQ